MEDRTLSLMEKEQKSIQIGQSVLTPGTKRDMEIEMGQECMLGLQGCRPLSQTSFNSGSVALKGPSEFGDHFFWVPVFVPMTSSNGIDALTDSYPIESSTYFLTPVSLFFHNNIFIYLFTFNFLLTCINYTN
jgi:hypothetical protein